MTGTKHGSRDLPFKKTLETDGCKPSNPKVESSQASEGRTVFYCGFEIESYDRHIANQHNLLGSLLENASPSNAKTRHWQVSNTDALEIIVVSAADNQQQDFRFTRR